MFEVAPWYRAAPCLRLLHVGACSMSEVSPWQGCSRCRTQLPALQCRSSIHLFLLLPISPIPQDPCPPPSLAGGSPSLTQPLPPHSSITIVCAGHRGRSQGKIGSIRVWDDFSLEPLCTWIQDYNEFMRQSHPLQLDEGIETDLPLLSLG